MSFILFESRGTWSPWITDYTAYPNSTLSFSQLGKFPMTSTSRPSPSPSRIASSTTCSVDIVYKTDRVDSLLQSTVCVPNCVHSTHTTLHCRDLVAAAIYAIYLADLGSLGPLYPIHSLRFLASPHHFLRPRSRDVRIHGSPRQVQIAHDLVSRPRSSSVPRRSWVSVVEATHHRLAIDNSIASNSGVPIAFLFHLSTRTTQ